MARPAALAVALGVAALAAAWAVAAWWLWQTTVPDGLGLPEVAAADVLAQPELDEAREFERFLAGATSPRPRPDRRSSLSTPATACASRGSRPRDASARGCSSACSALRSSGSSRFRSGSSTSGGSGATTSPSSATSSGSSSTGSPSADEFLFLCLALLIVMGLAGPLGNWWWIPGAFVFVGLAALLTFVSPYLIPAQRDPPRLVREADQLAEEEGLPPIPVRIQEVDSWESPNAAATGLGPTRRIILWNTLVDSFDHDEVRVVSPTSSATTPGTISGRASRGTRSSPSPARS